MSNRQFLRTLKMRPTLVAAACLMLATPALAQQAQPVRTGAAAGMRYLSWAGKAGSVTVPAPAEAPPAAPASDGLRRPAPVIARVTAPSTPMTASTASYAARPSRFGATTTGLTPASAWIGGGEATPSSTAVAYAPAPAPMPEPRLEPRPTAAEAPRPAPGRAPAPTPTPTPPASTANDPAPVLTPVPASTDFDPMAPRRDALIYRMQGATPVTPTQLPRANAEAEPAREGARYYSVHRAAGHQPDPTIMPEAVYLDTAPIDLAEPPATPTIARTVNGRAQVIVPNEDPSLP